MNMISIEKDYSIKLSSKVINYTYPDYVFIPMEEYKLKVKNKEAVKKEQILLAGDGVNIYSPVSGIVVGVKECLTANGKLKKSLVIENDFKEKFQERTTMRKTLKQLNKKDFFDILNKKIIFQSENHEKLLIEKFKNESIQHIVINGVEDEPYFANKEFLFKNYTSEILEMISFLSRIFNVSDNTIVFKNSSRDNIEQLKNVLGTYPEISLTVVPDVYPIERVSNLNNHINYDFNTTIFLTPEELLSCHNLIKNNKLLFEKYITISGEAIINPIIINVKLGSSVKKIIEENIAFLNNDPVCYTVNGLMTGKILDIDDLIVTDELKGVIINFDKEAQERSCINCGKCSFVCPAGLDPNLIFNRKNNIEDKDKCFDCGLCTYICPSYINFKKRIEEIKNEK